MTWWAVVDASTGRLVSDGEDAEFDAAVPLDAALEKIPLLRGDLPATSRPDWAVDAWDEATRRLVVRPPRRTLRDLVAEIMTDPRIANRPQNVQDAVRAVLEEKIVPPFSRFE